MSTAGKRNIFIWGAGGHASVVADIICQIRRWRLAGFADDIHPERQGTLFCGYPILKPGQIDRLAKEPGGCDVVIGIGQCKARLRLTETAKTKGLRLAAIIHPSAVIAHDVKLGAGTVVVAGAIINRGCVIGESVIINTGASVDHDCVVGDAAHICPGVALGGEVHIGAGTWIGIGSSIIEKTSVGAACLVGAGSLVLSNLPDRVVAYGSPARVIRKHRADIWPLSDSLGRRASPEPKRLSGTDGAEIACH